MKYTNPKSLDEAQKNIEDIERNTVKKTDLSKVQQLKITGTITNTWGSNEATIVTNAINTLNQLLDSLIGK